MSEWPIREVARATGLTSRTLRHYEQVGLLRPSRVDPNGYRHYGEDEVARIYRILSLRAIDMPLPAIKRAIIENQDLSAIVRSHASLLKQRRDETDRQLFAVEQLLHAIDQGSTMTIHELFANFDHSTHEAEVRKRWGDGAWQDISPLHATDNQEEAAAVNINDALRRAAQAGEEPTSPHFQELVSQHHQWVSENWKTAVLTTDAYLGLAQLYTADERFSNVYGGQAAAEIVHRAIQHWATKQGENIS